MTYTKYRQMVWNYYFAGQDFKVINWIPSSDLSKAVERTYNDGK